MTREEYGHVGGYLLRIEHSRRATSRLYSRAEVVTAWLCGMGLGIGLMLVGR